MIEALVEVSDLPTVVKENGVVGVETFFVGIEASGELTDGVIQAVNEGSQV